MALPYPPLKLADRVGRLTWDDPWKEYNRIGASCEQLIRGSLPADWWSDGRRVLDFGCGAGRVLRHFSTDAESGEFWGCDIDGASIDWCRANLSPPFRFFRNDELPPLPHPDQSFDLIYAMSVFTHLLDS